MERGAMLADDIAPIGERLAGSVADLIVEPWAFENHRQTVKPLHLVVCQDLAIPFKHLDSLLPDAFVVKIRMKGEKVVVAAYGGDFVFPQEVDAFPGGAAVADDVACAQHVIDRQALKFGDHCAQSVDVAMYVTNHA